MLNGDASKAREHRCCVAECRAVSRVYASQVSQRAKKRGLPQMGTLGAGNHYAEIQARMPRAVLCCSRVALTSASQVVDEIFDTWAANKMGIDRIGQVCVMIHSGSRGLGHQARARRGAGSPRVVSSPDASREPRWPPTRWSRWRPRWRGTASTPTTGSLHARASTPRRVRITWCGTPCQLGIPCLVSARVHANL